MGFHSQSQIKGTPQPTVPLSCLDQAPACSLTSSPSLASDTGSELPLPAPWHQMERYGYHEIISISDDISTQISGQPHPKVLCSCKWLRIQDETVEQPMPKSQGACPQAPTNTFWDLYFRNAWSYSASLPEPVQQGSPEGMVSKTTERPRRPSRETPPYSTSRQKPSTKAIPVW